MLWLPPALPDQRTAVRRAGPRDAAGMAVVHVLSWQTTYRGQIGDAYLDGLTVPAFDRHWRHIFAARGWAFVATVDDRVVGVASGGKCRRRNLAEGEIYVLYLDPVYKGLGLGRALFDACHYELARRGHADCLAWVLGSNAKARGFYEHLGGTLVAEGEIVLGQERLHEVGYRWQA